MLRVDNLSVRYGRITALRGVSFEVREGEVVGLIGPNGAGKTTTISTIMGSVRPAHGAIRFAGEQIVGRTPEEIVRRGVAIVPEGRRIFGTLTVRENLVIGATTRRDGNIEADIAGLASRFPILGEYMNTPAGKLSGGEQQQLAIARALLAKPKLLLLDEPSLGLAPLIVDEVFHVLGELRERGITILLVEQNARRTLAFADRCYVLRQGTIWREAARDSVEGRDIEEAFLGLKVDAP